MSSRDALPILIKPISRRIKMGIFHYFNCQKSYTLKCVTVFSVRGVIGDELWGCTFSSYLAYQSMEKRGLLLFIIILTHFLWFWTVKKSRVFLNRNWFEGS